MPESVSVTIPPEVSPETEVGVARYCHDETMTFTPRPGQDAEQVSGSMEAGKCNAHHVTLGDSNPKAQAPSTDTGTGGLAMESMKSGEG